MRISTALVLLAGFGALAVADAAAKQPSFSKRLTREQARCLSDLLHTPSLKDSPDENAEMKEIAQVATVELDGPRRKHYVFLFERFEFCGTAGCSMIIGEETRDGTCRLLYDDYSDGTFTVLRRRDHGYRRFYSPCEARFDGRQYQLLHENCPSPRAWH